MFLSQGGRGGVFNEADQYGNHGCGQYCPADGGGHKRPGGAGMCLWGGFPEPGAGGDICKRVAFSEGIWLL